MEHKMFSEKELEFRRSVIGASQVGGLIGVAKSPTKMQLFDWLVNGVSYSSDSVFAEVGTHMEEWVAKKFVETYSAPGAPVVLMNPRDVWPDTYGILRHPEYPWVGATLDRFIQGTYEPVELKFINNPKTVAEYGEEGSEKIPEGYHAQMVIQLATIRDNCKVWGVELPNIAYHFAYLSGKFKAFVIEWTPETEEAWRFLLGHLIAFREDFWLPSIGKPLSEQIAPPAAGEQAYEAFLLRKREESGPTDIIRSDESQEVVDWFQRHQAATKIEKAAAAVKKAAAAELVNLIGTDTGVKGGFGTFRLTGGKDSTKTDWEAVANALMMSVPRETWTQVVEANTITYKSNVSARAYPKKTFAIEDSVRSEVLALIESPQTLTTEDDE